MNYDFKLNSNKREGVTLEDFKGKKLVLYFYPKDNTSGCTLEAQEFAEHYEEIKALGAEVVGLSKDTVRTHENFAKKYELPFELLSDLDRVVLEQYDLIKLKKMYGKEVRGTVRSTFIFDENSNLIKEFRDVKAAGHAEEVLEYLKGLEK